MSAVDSVTTAIPYGPYVAALRQVEKQATGSPPAEPMAVPQELARAEVNQAAVASAMMFPTADNIYSIGSTAVKSGGALSVTKSLTRLNQSLWGF